MNGLLMHRRESTEYVQPAHIIAQARKAKRLRRREEEREQRLRAPKAITERTPPPPDFRQMIEGATAGMFTERQLTTGKKSEAQREAARAELKLLSQELGEPAL